MTATHAIALAAVAAIRCWEYELATNKISIEIHTISGWYSGYDLDGRFFMSAGVENPKINSAATAQPTKSLSGAPYQSTGSFVGCQNQ